jgi:hypothetical protein
VRRDKSLGQSQEFVERRACARSHDIGGMWRDRLDAAWANRRFGPGNTGRLAQKRGFSRIRLDQLDAGSAEDRKHQPRQTRAAAEIYETSSRLRN